MGIRKKKISSSNNIGGGDNSRNFSPCLLLPLILRFNGSETFIFVQCARDVLCCFFSFIAPCFCVNTQALLFSQSLMHFPNEIASIVSRHKIYPSFCIFIFCVWDFFLFISLTFIKLEMLNTYYTHSIIIMTLTMIDEFKMNVHSMLDSHFFCRCRFFAIFSV